MSVLEPLLGAQRVVGEVGEVGDVGDVDEPAEPSSA